MTRSCARIAALLLGVTCVGLGCQTKADDKFAATTSGSGSAPGSRAPIAAGSGSASTVVDPESPPRPPPPPLPSPLPGKRTDLTASIGKAWRAVICDLDGNGKREIVAIDGQAIHVIEGGGHEVSSTPVTSGIQVLVAGDLDGNKHDELYAGWGQTREFMSAKARITQLRLDKGKLVEQVVLAPETEREEVVAIVPAPDVKGLIVAYFDSKYMVTSMAMTKGVQGWSGTKLATLRTAPLYARGDIDGDSKLDLVVGRVYGDDRGIDGDVFVLAPDGTRTKLPSTRGLRSLTLADGDGDGVLDVFMGDGWHQNYGQMARGLLTWVRHRPSGFTSELVEDTQGQFELMRILPARIDGKLALVTQGSHYVRVFVRSGDTWSGTTIAGQTRDIAVGDLDGKPGDEILVIGDTSELVNLAGIVQ
jgi:hypothetical protein